MGLEILKDGKLKKLLKAHSGKEQSSEAARERIDQLVTELLIQVAQLAGKSAESEKLTRIMPSNVDAAFAEIMSQADVAPEPSRFLEALHKMEVKEIGTILRLIGDWTRDLDKGSKK